MTLAHAGHWYHSLLYLLPVLLVSAALWWSGRGEGEGEGAAPGDVDELDLEPAQTPRDAGRAEAPDAPERAAADPPDQPAPD